MVSPTLTYVLLTYVLEVPEFFKGRCPSIVRPVFPVLVFQLAKQATEP